MDHQQRRIEFPNPVSPSKQFDGEIHQVLDFGFRPLLVAYDYSVDFVAGTVWMVGVRHRPTECPSQVSLLIQSGAEIHLNADFGYLVSDFPVGGFSGVIWIDHWRAWKREMMMFSWLTS